jgi:hypothetical protein
MEHKDKNKNTTRRKISRDIEGKYGRVKEGTNE